MVTCEIWNRGKTRHHTKKTSEHCTANLLHEERVFWRHVTISMVTCETWNRGKTRHHTKKTSEHCTASLLHEELVFWRHVTTDACITLTQTSVRCLNKGHAKLRLCAPHYVHTAKHYLYNTCRIEVMSALKFWGISPEGEKQTSPARKKKFRTLTRSMHAFDMCMCPTLTQGT